MKVLNIILHISSYPMHTRTRHSIFEEGLFHHRSIRSTNIPHMHICNAPSIPFHITKDIPVPNQATAPTPFQCIMFGIPPPKERTHESINSPTPPAPNKIVALRSFQKNCIKTYVVEDLSQFCLRFFVCM